MSSTHTDFKKEYDDSPPRNGVIFFYAVLTVFVLIGVKFLLDSYFAKTMEGEVQEKVLTVGLDEVAQKRAAEKAALEKAGISAAAKALAQRGRTSFPEIAPAAAKEQPEVQGWTQLGRTVPVAPAASNQVTPTPGVQPAEPAGDVGPGQKPMEQTTPSSNVNPQGRSK